MGLSPIPPYYYNGVVWEESACGEHMMEEHLLSDRLNVNIVCGADRLRCPAIRVRPPQERACAFWQNDYRRREQNWQISHFFHSGIALRRSGKEIAFAFTYLLTW